MKIKACFLKASRKPYSLTPALAVGTLLTFFALVSAVHAAPIVFAGFDSGAGPTDPHPGSDAAATVFDAAAGALGLTGIITFEAAPVSSFSSLMVAPGVTISGTDFVGADQSIGSSPANPSDPEFDGYNTTAGGSNFAEVLGGTLIFTFSTPIDLFGAYFSGVQDPEFGSVTLTFDDGSSQVIELVPLTSVGGLQFFGFTDAGALITSVTIVSGSGGDSDFIGLDDVRYGSVPEGSSALLLGMGLIGCFIVHRAYPYGKIRLHRKAILMKHWNRTAKKGLAILSLASVISLTVVHTSPASSHREAPLISEDPVADATDMYAFVSPDDPTKLTLIGNWIPFEEPAGGPNFYRFSDDVLYTIQIDNNGDAVADISYLLRFTTTVKNPNTFLYNTGPITAVTNGGGKATDYINLSIQQSYTLTEVKNGGAKTLGTNLLVAPANVGPRSTSDYGSLADAAVYTPVAGVKVFAGPRDDPFFADSGSIFDLLGLRPFNGFHAIPLPAAPGKDALKGFNVHTIALQVPITRVLKPKNPDPVIGVWSSTSRLKNGVWVQISRLGHPWINATFIPLGQKDTFNASKPANDSQFAASIVDPELGHLIPALYPVFSCFPTAPRNDLVTIFLTGIPGLNQPASVVGSEELRINTSTPPTPFASQIRMGLLAGQADGFPNGRRLIDDVIDIELQFAAGASPLGACNGQFPNNALADGVDANDVPFLTTFPYLALPHQGYDHTH